MTAQVSVVIPAFRAAPTIRRALLSVSAQSLKPLEALVIDDGSDDGTLEEAEACRPLMAGIELRILRQDNQGAGAARNAGVMAAKGDWLAFLDADDEWLPEKLKRSLAHTDGATLIAHDYIEVKNGQEVHKDCMRHLTAAKDPFSALMQRGFIPSITVLAKRADVLAVGGFEESLPAAQDYDLWLKLLQLPQARLVMFPEALARYHVSDSGITSKVEQRRQCSLAVLARHAGSLKGRKLETILMRCLIIQGEAVAAHWAQRNLLAAAGTALLTPFTLAEGFFARFGVVFFVVWSLAVFSAYYFHSYGYYEEKISVFSRFLLQRLMGS